MLIPSNNRKKCRHVYKHRITRQMETEVYHSVPIWVVADMLKYIEEKNTSHLYGSGSVKFKLYCFLLYLVRGIGGQKVEEYTNFPHSNCHQCFGLLRSILKDWAKTKIVPSTYNSRKIISSTIVENSMFKKYTLVADSKDYKISKQDKECKKSKHHSYKENCHGIRVQFMQTHDNIVRWVRGPFYTQNI